MSDQWTQDDIDNDQIDDDVDEDEQAEMEAEMNCGRYAGNKGCSLAGTEYCDWSCPFSDALYRRPRRKKFDPRQGEL